MSRSACGGEKGRETLAALDEANGNWWHSALIFYRARKDVAANDPCRASDNCASLPDGGVRSRAFSFRDETGKDYIDASGGAAVSCLGHSHPDVIGACARNSTSWNTRIPLLYPASGRKLADDLVPHGAEGLSHAFFVSAGPRHRAALKAARQYSRAWRGRSGCYLIRPASKLPRRHTGALAVGGREWQRRQFAPLLIETHMCRGLRIAGTPCGRNVRPPMASGSLRSLDAKIDELGGGM